MKCDAYKILIREMEQDELTAEEADFVQGHLDTCENCRAYQAGLRAGGESPSSRSMVRPWGWGALLFFGAVLLVALVLAAGHWHWSGHGVFPHRGRRMNPMGWRMP